MNKNNYWFLSEHIKKGVDKTDFISWEAGLNSTERRNKARVIKALNALDELNSNNLRDGHEFFLNLSMAIKEFIGEAGFKLECNGNTYSLKRLKQ